MSKNIDQVFIANPITSNASTDLMYFGQSPYGAGNDAAMTYANFAAQFGAPYTPAALTRANDTNVTITLGGTPSTALLHAASLTMGWTGQLALTRGGSNASLTASNGGIVYSTASAMAILSGTATAGLPLLSGLSTAPTWGAFVLSLGGALTTAGALTTSGAFGATFTFTNTTGVTFPTSGTLATTAGSLPSIQGTANEVLVNGTSGSPVSGTAITLTTPQAIGTSSTPQFSGAYFGSPTGPQASASGTAQAVGFSGNAGTYVAATYFNGSGSSPGYHNYKSRSTAVGSFVTVQSGDELGRFLVFGDDGTQFKESGAIVLQATGTVSSGIVPGLWSFVTANASGSLINAMTIDENQLVTATIALHSNGVITAGSTISSGSVAGGTAGSLALYSPTAAKGSLNLTVSDNSGNFNISITNASFAQNTILTVPDPGSSSANFALSKAAISWTPTANFLTQGNLSVAYAVQSGNYVKVGNIVIATYQITFTPTYTTAANSFFVGGLVLTPANNSFAGVNFSDITLSVLYTSVTANAQNDGNIYIYQNGSGQTRNALSVTQLTSGNQYSLYGTIVYMI